jgi:hypothetical protein
MATLAQARQAEVAAYTTAATAASTELSQATQALDAASTALLQAEQAIKTTNDAIASKRRQLPEATNPSAAAARNLEIRDLIIIARQQTGAALDARDAKSEAKAAAAGARARNDRAAAGKARAVAASAAEAEPAARRQAQVAALGAAPLATLQADAAAVLAGTSASEAELLIEENFPAELLALSVERHTTRRAAIQAARQSVSAAYEADGTDAMARQGIAGTLDTRARAFDRAEAELADFVAKAKQRFDAAVAVLANLERIRAERQAGRPMPDILSDYEKTDIAVDADRTAAANAATPIEGLRRAITAAQTALDQEIITRIDGASIDTYPTSGLVATRRAAVVSAGTALTNAVAALGTNGEKATLDQWEIIAPDGAWQVLTDYLEARAVLGDLGATAVTGANSIASRLSDAEDAYAAAIQAEGRALRRAGAYQDAITEREARLEAQVGAGPLRFPSAVRGDSC